MIYKSNKYKYLNKIINCKICYKLYENHNCNIINKIYTLFLINNSELRRNNKIKLKSNIEEIKEMIDKIIDDIYKKETIDDTSLLCSHKLPLWAFFLLIKII